MPAYNHGQYLVEAIESVLSQRIVVEMELLIGDDCSSDNTRQIACEYQQRYPTVVRVITADCNVGMHENHRRLIEASRGQYLAYCEGDDYWHEPDKVSIQQAFLDAHEDYGAVHSEFTHIAFVRGKWRGIAHAWERARIDIPQGHIFDFLLRRNLILTCTVMLRADLVRQYFGAGFPVDSYPVGDWPLFLFVSGKSKIAYIPRSLATYRKVPGSVTNQGYRAEVERVPAYIRMLDDLSCYFRVSPARSLEARRVMMRTFLKNALAAGDEMQAIEVLEWFSMHDPVQMPSWKLRSCRIIARNAWFTGLLRRGLTVRDTIRTFVRFTAQPASVGREGETT